MKLGFKAQPLGPRASSPPLAGETPAVPGGVWLLHPARLQSRPSAGGDRRCGGDPGHQIIVEPTLLTIEELSAKVPAFGKSSAATAGWIPE